MAAHLHWRIAVKEVQSSSALYLGELRFLTSAGVDVTSGGTPLAVDASDNPAYPREQLFDKSLATNGWYSSTPTPNTWVGYTFPAPVDVDRVSIASNYNANGAPKEGQLFLEWSDNGADWTRLGRMLAETPFTAWVAREERLFVALVAGAPGVTSLGHGLHRLVGNTVPYAGGGNSGLSAKLSISLLVAGMYRAVVDTEVKGAPNQPVAPRYVRLHEGGAGSGRVVAGGWTELVTVEGEQVARVVFERLQFGTYYAVGFDHTGVYDGEVAVNVPLELM